MLGERAARDRGGQSRARRARTPAISTGSIAVARAAALWTRDALDADHADYLARSPLPRDDRGGDAACTPARAIPRSGTISSPRRTGSRSSVISTRGSASSATRTGRPRGRSARAAPSTRLAVSPGMVAACSFEDGRRYIVNVGSVGQPRDRDPRAAYVLWDRDERTVTIRAGRLRPTGPPRPRSSPPACRARWPSVSPVASERARASRERLARGSVLLAARVWLGALAFPGTDWSLFAWIWLVPGLVLRAWRGPRAARSRTAGSPAPCSSSSSCAGSTHTFLHFSAIPWP